MGADSWRRCSTKSSSLLILFSYSSIVSGFDWIVELSSHSITAIDLNGTVLEGLMLALELTVGCWIALAIALLGVMVLAPIIVPVLVAIFLFLLTSFVSATIYVDPVTVAFEFAIIYDYVLTPCATLSLADLFVAADAFDITITFLTTLGTSSQ